MPIGAACAVAALLISGIHTKGWNFRGTIGFLHGHAHFKASSIPVR
jgi:hypothetical protein